MIFIMNVVAINDELVTEIEGGSAEVISNNTVEVQYESDNSGLLYESNNTEYVGSVNVYYNTTSGEEPNTYVGEIPDGVGKGIFNIPNVNKNTKIRLENSVNEITINISDSEVEDDNSDANDTQSSVEDSSNTRLERPFGETILNTTE